MSAIDNLRIPRVLINLVHRYRVWLHPRYSDEAYDTGIVMERGIEDVKLIFVSWGFEIDHPSQYVYANQIGSAHRHLRNGKQLHVRMYCHDSGCVIKAHVEWHGVTHPILHTMYANLDYELGRRMLQDLIDSNGRADLDAYEIDLHVIPRRRRRRRASQAGR